MPGHGNHWEALYSLSDYVQEKIKRDIEKSLLICRADCVDVQNGTDRTEQVTCLRWGAKQFANQILVVSNSAKQSNFLFSSYPVALDGVDIDVAITSVNPWEYCIEGWIHGEVTSESIPISFFDTMFFTGSATFCKGDVVHYRLAGLAYSLRPIQTQFFEIINGDLWELERKRRLEAGESEEESNRPVKMHMAGAAIFLPRSDDQCDEAEFQGVIKTLDVFEYDEQKIYRMDIVLMRPGNEEFCLPVYASERVLDGYIPKLGEDVEGVLWVQGRRPETDGC
ncbi:MAG: hypothetical protein LBH31_05240 [Burkholderiaceae bacterium]|jgi:hypothetical protein|nr:hypothetical protein [Burkholderiaceae bacterium]